MKLTFPAKDVIVKSNILSHVKETDTLEITFDSSGIRFNTRYLPEQGSNTYWIPASPGDVYWPSASGRIITINACSAGGMHYVVKFRRLVMAQDFVFLLQKNNLMRSVIPLYEN